MKFPPLFPRITLPCLGWLLLTLGGQAAGVPPQLVLVNGRAVPVSSVVLKGAEFQVTAATLEYTVGSTIPLSSVDHVYGDKPAEIDQAIALMLLGRRDSALGMLEPVLAKHKDTAKLPGNFWLEAARAAVVAYAANGKAAPATDLAKAISDATPAQGSDPISGLARALAMPSTVDFKERVDALRVQAAPELPADISAYATFYRAELHMKRSQVAEALEAYLSVTCLYPSGGMILNGVAQYRAAELLAAAKRPEEALVLVNSALRRIKGTPAEAEARKLLDSIK